MPSVEARQGSCLDERSLHVISCPRIGLDNAYRHLPSMSISNIARFGQYFNTVGMAIVKTALLIMITFMTGEDVMHPNSGLRFASSLS